MRVIAEYEKLGSAAWISHLDLQRTIGRALRRARISVAYSQGFNPHPLLSFATALSVGCPSQCEVMDVHLLEDADPSPEDFISAMNAALPEGIRILRACLVDESAPAPMAIATAAVYTVVTSLAPEAAAKFLSQAEILATKRSKKGLRTVDIAPMIYHADAEPWQDGTRLRLTLRQDNALALNPTLLLQAMGADVSQLRRIQLLAGDVPLYDRYA